MLPEHIWNKVTWANVNTFDPAHTKYKDWTGLNPPNWTTTAPFDSTKGGFKALVGSGPFVLDYWDQPTGTGHLIRNPNYWTDWERADVNIDLQVNIVDITLAATSFGAKIGEPRWSASSDIDANNVINIVDLGKIAIKFGWKGSV
jgi:hypothetical protein